MSDKEKVVKLNALLKKNNGKINYNSLKSLKIKDNKKIKEKVSKIKGGNIISDNSGVIKPANPSEVAKSLNLKYPTATMSSKIVHTGQGYSRGQIIAKKDDSKVNKIYSAEPDVPIKFNRDTIKGYSPDEAENGLDAADKGLATTLNGGYAIMNNRLREPDFYNKVSVRNDLLPLGYKAAYMINSLHKRLLPELQSPEELRVKRKQVMENFSVILKKIGSTALRAAIGELANDMSLETYDAVGIVDKVIANIPSNIETIPNDTDAMQALITGLNNTSKKALILDEIYVNAMLTMFLNDYNRKNMRPTYFLLRPYDEMKSFTDSEGMFSNQLNVTKIRSVTHEYNFAGTDFIYVDTSLMKDYTFHIICELINKVKTTFNDASNYCQIVIKTNTNLGTNENEFFKNMGKTIFSEIFETAVNAEGISVEEAYNIITGKQQNNERLNDQFSVNNIGLRQLHTETEKTGIRIGELNDNLTAIEEYRLKEAKAQKEAEIKNLDRSIDKLQTRITYARNAADGAKLRNQLDESNRFREEQKMLEIMLLAKQIEVSKLLGEDTTDLEIELKQNKDEKTKALVKAEQEEIAALVRKEREREQLASPPRPARATKPDVAPTATTMAREMPNSQAIFERHKLEFATALNKIVPAIGIKSNIQGYETANAVRQVISYISKNMNLFTSKKYDFIVGAENKLSVKEYNSQFDFTHFIQQLLNVGSAYLAASINSGSTQGKKMCETFVDTVNNFNQGVRRELREAQSMTAPIPSQEEEEVQGQGISSYRHVRGGSISSFIEKMHDEINIKSIVKFNKSAYVINI